MCFHFYLIAGTEQKSKIQVCPEMLTVMWSENWNGCAVILAGRASFEPALWLPLLLSLSSLLPVFLLLPSLSLPSPSPSPLLEPNLLAYKAQDSVTPENSHEFTKASEKNLTLSTLKGELHESSSQEL